MEEMGFRGELQELGFWIIEKAGYVVAHGPRGDEIGWKGTDLREEDEVGSRMSKAGRSVMDGFGNRGLRRKKAL